MTRPAGTSTTPEVLVLDAVAVLLLLGLALVVSAVYGLAGLWWALFTTGILLAALAVLLARGQRRSTSVDATSAAHDGDAP